MKKVVLALALATSLSSAFAASVEVDLSLDMVGRENFFQISNTKFQMLNSHADVKTTAVAIVDGKRFPKNTASNSAGVEAKEGSFIEVLNNNFVRIVDTSITESNGKIFDHTIKADIKKTVFGKIKSISIAKDDYTAAYHDVFESIGLANASALSQQIEGVTLKTSLNFSGYECKLEDKALSCLSSGKIEVIIKGESN